MSLQFCLVLLAVSSLTTASDPACDELIKPLEDRTQVYGKWIFYAGTSDLEHLLKELTRVHSSWIDLSPIPDSDDMALRYGDMVDGKCFYGNATSTFLGNSSKVTFYFNSSSREHVGNHLVTCPDCILWSDTIRAVDSEKTRNGKNLYLFTKSGTLGASHLDVFKKQAKCLNLGPDFHFGKTTKLCPDEKEAATDVTKEEQ